MSHGWPSAHCCSSQVRPTSGTPQAFAAAVVYLSLMHALFGTEALTVEQLAIVAPFPFHRLGSR